jgi:hypothetical protein
MNEFLLQAMAVRRFLRLGIPVDQALKTADKLLLGRTVLVIRNHMNSKPMLILTIGAKPIK